MIAILKYNAGNATSVLHAVRALGYEACITDDPATLRTADKVIFPGVGAAAAAMAYLRAKKLDILIRSLRQPVLGICLGQQLLCSYSEEGAVSCLGIFDTIVKRFPEQGERVPHMGWNNVTHNGTGLFQGLEASCDMYFVHSYYCPVDEYSVATCDYILPFAAAMQKDNFFTTQFHPEKSSRIGKQVLANFLNTSI